MKEDLAVVYEGNAFEVMRFMEILAENNIHAFTNEDISGGLNPNNIAQIIVTKADEEKASKIINKELSI